MTNTIIISVIIIAIIFSVIFLYNNLIRSKNRVLEAWSDIDVQLKRRYNLIPNLINTVKGYAKHERETLEEVIQARNKAMNTEAGDSKNKVEAENQLSSTLKSIFALSENYPDLKANQNFLNLQDELSDTENKIQAARRFYNNNVQDFNTKLQVFPTNIIAKQLNFVARDFFEIEDPKEKKNIKVEF